MIYTLILFSVNLYYIYDYDGMTACTPFATNFGRNFKKALARYYISLWASQLWWRIGTSYCHPLTARCKYIVRIRVRRATYLIIVASLIIVSFIGSNGLSCLVWTYLVYNNFIEYIGDDIPLFIAFFIPCIMMLINDHFGDKLFCKRHGWKYALGTLQYAISSAYHSIISADVLCFYDMLSYYGCNWIICRFMKTESQSESCGPSDIRIY